MNDETVAICGAEFARCVCTLPAGHADAHECNPPCGGSWRVNGAGDQVPVRYPLSGGPAAEVAALLAPWWQDW